MACYIKPRSPRPKNKSVVISYFVKDALKDMNGVLKFHDESEASMEFRIYQPWMLGMTYGEIKWRLSEGNTERVQQYGIGSLPLDVWPV